MTKLPARTIENKLVEMLVASYALSQREAELAADAVNGHTVAQQADKFGICEKTVKFHRGHIFRKMKLKNYPSVVAHVGKLALNASR